MGKVLRGAEDAAETRGWHPPYRRLNQISKQRNGDLASSYQKSEAHMGTERNKKTKPVLLDGPGGASVNTAPTAETDAEIVRGVHTLPSCIHPEQTSRTLVHINTPLFFKV